MTFLHLTSLPVLSFQKRLLTTCEHAKDEGLILFYPFKWKSLTTIKASFQPFYDLFYPFKWKSLTTDYEYQVNLLTLFYPFKRRLLTTLFSDIFQFLHLFYPFKRRLLTTPFYVKPNNKDLYNRKVSEIFHNFTVSLLPNTLLFMFHSHYFIKYSKN